MERMKKEKKVHLEGAKVYGPQDYEVVDELKKLRNENKNLNKQIEQFKKGVKAGTKIIERLEEENKKLKHENSYRAGIVDILPKGKGHIAEETIQDLQKRIDELVWFEKEYHRSRDRIKKLEWILEHEYGRKVPY